VKHTHQVIQMSKPAEILRKIEDDLSWRGPTGKQLAHVVIEREDMFELLKWIKWAIRPECARDLIGE
jgi:hypothetical protein